VGSGEGRGRHGSLALVVTLVLSALSCGPRKVSQPQAAPTAWLVDEAEQRGVRFVLDSGATEGRWALPEIMSGGVALFDIEPDGDLDLYFVQSGDLLERANRPPNRLFENLGAGTFRDITANSGSGDRGWGMGVATGDVDNDGLVDLYVTNLGPNVLLRNRGDGTFIDVTATAGVGDGGFSSGATMLDYDLDGDLDIFSLNYFDWSPEIERPCFDQQGRRDYCRLQVYEAPAANRLYRNRGDGTFDDATAASGLGEARSTSLGVVAGDFTGDGWPDLFVANDGMPDRLWVGGSGGRFRDESAERACAVDSSGQSKAGMGVEAADLDDDGDLDLLVGNLKGESDSLYVNERDEFFVDAAARYGLVASSRTVTRFGLGLVDFDNDGRLDLLEVAGAVFGRDPVYGYGEPNRLLRQTEEGRFEEVPGGLLAGSAVETSRGAAFGDIDGDGWIDAVVVNRDAAANVMVNQGVDARSTLAVVALNRWGSPALGASIVAEVGGVSIRREVRTASGYLAAHDPRVWFAFAPEQRPERLEVRWAGGEAEAFATGRGDTLVVRQGAKKTGTRQASPR